MQGQTISGSQCSLKRSLIVYSRQSELCAARWFVKNELPFIRISVKWCVLLQFCCTWLPCMQGHMGGQPWQIIELWRETGNTWFVCCMSEETWWYSGPHAKKNFCHVFAVFVAWRENTMWSYWYQTIFTWHSSEWTGNTLSEYFEDYVHKSQKIKWKAVKSTKEATNNGKDVKIEKE